MNCSERGRVAGAGPWAGVWWKKGVLWAVACGMATSAAAVGLQEARTTALARHPDAALADNGVRAAAADLQAAGQRPNPALSVQTVNINPSRGIGSGPPTRQYVDTTVGLTWLVERGGKRDLRVAGGEARQAAARADRAETLRQLRLTVDWAYFDLKRAQDRLLLVDAALALQQRGYEIAERRLRAGDLAAVEVARLQVELARAQAERAQAVADRTLAQRALAAAMGLDGPPAAARDLSADDDYPAVPAEASADATTRAPAAEVSPVLRLDAIDTAAVAAPIDSRPDVIAAQRRVEAARAQRELAEATTRRDVTVGVSAERYPPDNRGSLGVGVSVPLFWRHAFEGERRRAEADAEAAELLLRRQRQQAEREQRQADDQLQAARTRLRTLEGPAQQAAQRALAGIELAYARGAAALTDVLDARRQLHALQLDLADARAAHAKALALWQANAVAGVTAAP
ncbi:MAG: TolC family protein [Burkholderiales bacterium]